MNIVLYIIGYFVIGSMTLGLFQYAKTPMDYGEKSFCITMWPVLAISFVAVLIAEGTEKILKKIFG